MGSLNVEPSECLSFPVNEFEICFNNFVFSVSLGLISKLNVLCFCISSSSNCFEVSLFLIKDLKKNFLIK